MDKDVQDALNQIWTRGVDQTAKRVDRLEDSLTRQIDGLHSYIDARFTKLEAQRHWSITQWLAVTAILVTAIITILQHAIR
jgi:hypothetical protein